MTCQWKTAARGRGCHLDRHHPRTPIRRVQAIYFAMASAVQPFQKYPSTVLVCRNVQDPWGLWAGESRAARLVVVCVCLCVHMFFVHGRSRTEDCSCSLWPCRYSCRTRRSMAAGVSPFNCRSPVAQFASRVACCWRASLPHVLCFTHGHYYLSLSLRPPLREAASSSLLAPGTSPSPPPPPPSSPPPPPQTVASNTFEVSRHCRSLRHISPPSRALTQGRPSIQQYSNTASASRKPVTFAALQAPLSFCCSKHVCQQHNRQQEQHS